MFPIIPLMCISGFVSSVLGMAWYALLPEEEQSAADEYAARLAQQMFRASLDNLTQHQADTIHRIVRQKFG